MSDPPRKKQRRPILSSEHSQQNKPTNINDLDDASLGTILDFLPGHFRFVGSVNRRFRFLYHHTPNTFCTAAMATDATRAIWFEEDEANVRANGCKFAAIYGNLEALQWLHSSDCLWDSGVHREAAARGHLHILHWARLQSTPYPDPWREWVCEAAALNGQLDILQWLRSQTPPCLWDTWTCAEAARNGQLDVLRWVRSQSPPCPWDTWTCSQAAENGQLDVLQWLRSQTPPCPWNEAVCTAAARYGQVDVLQWLRSQTPPCPWNIQDCLRVAKRGSDMEVFIRSHP